MDRRSIRSSITGAFVLGWLMLPVCLLAAEKPRPTPTPHPQSLADLAKATKLKRDLTAADGSIEITDSNLAKFAEKGRLTHTNRPAVPPPAPTEADAGVSEVAKRRLWREEYKKQQDLVQSLRDGIEALDSEIPALWNQFYAWDDPAYRDGVIKPKLDAALIRREELERGLQIEGDRLPEILEQARKDGALPSWFRDLRK